jgi:hypothetical protein
MLPTTLAANAAQAGRSRVSKAHGYFSTYFRRIVKPRQMDFEWVPSSKRALGRVYCFVALVVMRTPPVHPCCCLCAQVHLLADAAAMYITKDSVSNNMAHANSRACPSLSDVAVVPLSGTDVCTFFFPLADTGTHPITNKQRTSGREMTQHLWWCCACW